MKYLYDLVFIIFSIIYLPYLVIKGKAHKDFKERFGLLPGHLEADRADVIWVHAVSVGEVKASELLVRELKENFPEKKVALSVTTKTGREAADKIFGDSVPKFYFPVDLHFVIRKVIRFIKPCVLVIFETEIWPNLILSFSRRKIPVILVNGRISDKSFKGYKLIRPIFGNTLKKITKFLMQTDEDANRIRFLGADPGSIKVCGNVKYDIGQNDKAQMTKEIQSSKFKLGIKEGETLIICGSTHKGEEEILLAAYRSLLKEFPSLRMLIAPRHIDRVGEVEKLSLKSGFTPKRFSTISTSHISLPNPLPTTHYPLLILDTIGELAGLYREADIVFMGGSLIKRGGHNIVEPARFARPIIFGQYMHNFRDMAGQFLKSEAALMAGNKEELIKSFKLLLTDKERREKMGRNALLLVDKNRGTALRIINEIKTVL